MTELFSEIYDAETGETTRVLLTEAEVTDFNERLAAHELAQETE